MKKIQYNTRIAPSNTGSPHLGLARTAYFNWLAARSTGGKFILRIDDTDQSRSDPKYTESFIQIFKWLGLNYDKIVYQSHRFPIYRGQAEVLKQAGLAQEKDGAIVLNLKNFDALKSWKDEVGGEIKITADDLSHVDGMVLIKSDGSPSYNFCSIIDDITLKINYVIRGVDHITNTAKQVVLYHLLTKPNGVLFRQPNFGDDNFIKFAHVGLICENKKPLSKRDGAASMEAYKEKGYHPDAMLNYMARMGWSPTVDDKTTALLPRERMLDLFFSGGKMRGSPANVDINKLDSFDRKYKALEKMKKDNL